MAEAAGLYYEIHGADDAPPLILSSGLGGSASYWAPNLEALTREYRVLLYDHRGTGRSDRAETGAFPMMAWARDILFLMQATGIERADIVGHAAGAVAGLALAAWQPERVARLVMVNGWSRPDPHFLRCFDARLLLLRHAGPEAYLRAQPIFLYPANWISANDAVLNAELAHQLSVFPTNEMLETRIAALRDFDLDERLSQFDLPVLLLAAADDMLVPSLCSRRLAERLPNGQLAMMDWGGHACNVTDPETFNRVVLDFLRR